MNLNEVKAKSWPHVASPLTFATEEEIRAVISLTPWPRSLGPVNMPIPVIIDRTVAAMSDFSRWRQHRRSKHHFLVLTGTRCGDACCCRHPT